MQDFGEHKKNSQRRSNMSPISENHIPLNDSFPNFSFSENLSQQDSLLFDHEEFLSNLTTIINELLNTDSYLNFIERVSKLPDSTLAKQLGDFIKELNLKTENSFDSSHKKENENNEHRKPFDYAFAPVLREYTEALKIWRDRNVSIADKASASEKLINTFEACCLEHVSQITETLVRLIEIRSGNLTNYLNPTLPTTSILDFINSPTENSIRRSLPALCNLVRFLWKAEELKIYALLSTGDNLSGRIQAAADLTKDAYYMARQGKALLSLAHISIKSIEKLYQDAENLSNESLNPEVQLRMFMDNAKDILATASPEIVACIQNLGIFWHKLAQTLGATTSIFNSTGYQKLETFQNQIPYHMSIPETKKIIEGDLGAPLESIFVEFDPNPCAVASVSQVHSAKILVRGQLRDVKVKVKKQNVQEELEWNVTMNQALVYWLKSTRLEGHESPLLNFIADQAAVLAKTFQGELDFIAEATRQSYFRRLFILNKDILIPRVYRKLCGPSVITMDDVGKTEKLNFDFNFNTQIKNNKKSIYDCEQEQTEDIDELNSTVRDLDRESNKAPSDEQVDENMELVSNEASKSITAFVEILNLLVMKSGYKLGPQYAQLFRSLGPPLGLYISSLVKLAPFLANDGLKKLSPEDRQKYDTIDQRTLKLFKVVLHMSLYIKELHSDLQPANILVDSKNRLHIIDFGQSVQTNGLAILPLRLVKNSVCGNAKKLAQTLAMMGTFTGNYSQADLIKDIQNIFDAHSIKKQSLFSFMLTGIFTKNSKSEASNQQLNDYNSSESSCNNDQIPNQGQQFRSNINLAKDRQTAKPRSEADLKNQRILLFKIASGLMMYPIHRAVYTLLKAYDQVMRRLGY